MFCFFSDHSQTERLPRCARLPNWCHWSEILIPTALGETAVGQRSAWRTCTVSRCRWETFPSFISRPIPSPFIIGCLCVLHDKERADNLYGRIRAGNVAEAEL